MELRERGEKGRSMKEEERKRRKSRGKKCEEGNR